MQIVLRLFLLYYNVYRKNIDIYLKHDKKGLSPIDGLGQLFLIVNLVIVIFLTVIHFALFECELARIK